MAKALRGTCTVSGMSQSPDVAESGSMWLGKTDSVRDINLRVANLLERRFAFVKDYENGQRWR